MTNVRERAIGSVIECVHELNLRKRSSDFSGRSLNKSMIEEETSLGEYFSPYNLLTRCFLTLVY